MSTAHSVSSPTPSSTAPPRSTTLPHRNSASSSSTVTVTPHDSTPTQTPTTTTATTTRTSVPNIHSSTITNPQSTPPQTHAGSRSSRQTSESSLDGPRPQAFNIHQYVGRIVSPGSVLFRYTDIPEFTKQRLQTATRVEVPDMDRRHPSSFQQLEKVSSSNYVW